MREVREQAQALADYVSRGGPATRWLESKEFSGEDRAAVLLAYADMADEEQTA